MQNFEGKILINGTWQTPDSGETLPVIDPSDGSEFGRIARGSAVDIERAVLLGESGMVGEW